MTEASARAEGAPSKIQPIIDTLAQIPHTEVQPLLDAKAAVDPQAGIIIVKIDKRDPITSEAGQDYSFYAARVLPPSSDNPNYVNPHVHSFGEEPYQFLSGKSGEMNMGRVVDGKVVWDQPKRVDPGDSIEIQEGEVHSFRNNGTEPFDFTFSCPNSHLTDRTAENPQGDRVFTKDMPNGIPPWYPKPTS